MIRLLAQTYLSHIVSLYICPFVYIGDLWVGQHCHRSPKLKVLRSCFSFVILSQNYIILNHLPFFCFHALLLARTLNINYAKMLYWKKITSNKFKPAAYHGDPPSQPCCQVPYILNCFRLFPATGTLNSKTVTAILLSSWFSLLLA